MDVSVLSLLILTLGLTTCQQAGWTSLSERDHQKVPRSDSQAGWTSLLEKSKISDAEPGGLTDNVKQVSQTLGLIRLLSALGIDSPDLKIS